MRWTVLALAAAAACGRPEEGVPLMPQHVVEPEVRGAFADEAVVVDSAFITQDSDGWSSLWLTDVPLLCDLAAQDAYPADAALVHAYLGPRAPITTTDYPVVLPAAIDSPSKAVAVVLLARIRDCAPVSAYARSGAVSVVATSNTGIRGELEAGFDAGALSGDFSALSCPALRDFSIRRADNLLACAQLP